MVKQAFIENIITMICTVTTVLGLYYMSGSFHSLWGLLMMLNVNTIKIRKTE